MPFTLNTILILDDGKFRRVEPTDDLEISGRFKASYFYGDGRYLTNINADQILLGTLPDDRLSGNVAKYDDAAPNFLNTVTANKFAGDGSLLTNLPAGQLVGDGQLPDGVLSPNIPRLDAPSNHFLGDVIVDGVIVADGGIVTKSRTSLVVGDNFIDLLAGNVNPLTDEAGGFTVTTRAVAGTQINATDFYPAVDVTNPYLVTLTDPTLIPYAPGDIIQISESGEGKNNGQYVVLAVDGPTRVIQVRGAGGTGLPEQVPFAHTNFVEQHLQNAFIVKVNMAVVAVSDGTLKDSLLRNIPVGTPCFNYQVAATASKFHNTWVNLDAFNTVTLQSAYNNGHVIKMTTAKGNLQVEPDVGQTAGFSLKGNAASLVGTTGGATLTVGDPSEQSLTDLVGRVSLPSNSLLVTPQVSVGAAPYDILCFDVVTQQAIPARASFVDVVPLGTQQTLTLASTVYGSKVKVNLTGAVAVGDRLYLSDVAGAAQKDAPATGEIWFLGKCEAVAGSVGLVTWTPQYITSIF